MIIIVDVSNFRSFQLFIGIVVEGVQTATVQVVDNLTSVNRSHGCSACNVTVEHTVHHHSFKVICIVGFCFIVVVAHNTAHICAASNGSIAIAVDDACATVQKTDYSTGFAGAAYATIEDAAVIDSGCSGCVGCNSSCVVTGRDGCIPDNDVLDDSILHIVEEGLVPGASNRGQLSVDGSLEGFAGCTNAV